MMLEVINRVALGCGRPVLTSALVGSMLALRTGSGSLVRSISTKPTEHTSSKLYVAQTGGLNKSQSPILIGLASYFERHMPRMGFFKPTAGMSFQEKRFNTDRHVELMKEAFKLGTPVESMTAVTEEAAIKLLASGKTEDLLDDVFQQFENYRKGLDMVLVEGTNIGGTVLNAKIASALGCQVLLVCDANPKWSAGDYYDHLMTEMASYNEHKAGVLGVLLNRVPKSEEAILNSTLRRKFSEADVNFLGSLPWDQVLGTVRLDEVRISLGAQMPFQAALPTDWRSSSVMDSGVGDVVVASGSVTETLRTLDSQRHYRPLVVSSMDRTDLILGLLAGHNSGTTPLAGILLTDVQTSRNGATSVLERIFSGLDTYYNAATAAGVPRRAFLPVMAVDKPLHEVVLGLSNINPAIIPTSNRKIERAKQLFEDCVTVAPLAQVFSVASQPERMTPKMFQYRIKQQCLNHPQNIVLPEGLDKRVLAAAAEVASRKLANLTVLGNPDEVGSEAARLGIDISGVNIIDYKASPLIEKYVEQLCDARKAKGLMPEVARDMLTDMNVFGTMMVYCGDADGMVSGAIHSTASTIRPGMQVLRTPDSRLVSSVFFMCLPDKVLVYGDCAVNPEPTPEQLAQIAVTSAETAAAFGIDPRVAMLSYSTFGSGSGPQVEKVTQAVEIAKGLAPELPLEGPIQYDAAVDAKVAAVKIKGEGHTVAGQANVLIFPDLNTGNNTYKAVQQSTGAIAMGPVMQGLRKPVNDLSRGCTVEDIVNTVCVTAVQAIGGKAAGR